MIITIAARKGGVAKTTTCVHLSVGLAELGHRVLLVDCDQQNHCAIMLGADPPTGLGAVILGNHTAADSICAVQEGLDLIAGVDLAGIDRYVITLPAGQERVIARGLENIAGDYDHIVCDTPPGFNVLGVAAVAFADKVICPVSMEVLAVYGLIDIEAEFAELRKLGVEADLGWVLPTFYDRRVAKSAGILRQLEGQYGDRMLSPIRYSTRFSELAAWRQTIYAFDPKGRGSEDYHRLAAEVS